MENNTVSDGKAMAIISYITLVGTIIAIIVNSKSKNPFTSFHIRQAFGILLTQILGSVVLGVLGIHFLGWAFNIFILVLWIIGLLAAIQGETKEVPILGDKFQEWFKGFS
ncbi:MAG: hypothetical protein CVT96_02585 [Bacteroidetes bacterium HGW-Bacteroidetes-13]|jgi:uncharacterized membrane protein|nr:MAG: hypothetical protein CVT96_02585 [Bacteroidetes bacterium HGW-Bacteroidetes-13]